MKKRSGFVANSSTSSFVLLGFDYSKEYDAMQESQAEEFGDMLNENGIFYIGYWNGEGGAPKGYSMIVGEYLAYISSGDCLECEVVDFDGLWARVKELKAKYSPLSEIKIWKGTMMS